MAKDFHNKPFDDETILKLQIFKGYIREWLPVFLSRKSFSTIYIFDFFAGPGKDLNGQEGSPLIIIDEVKKYLSNPEFPYTDKVNIKLFFNDDDSEKIISLQKEIESKDRTSIEIKLTNNKFRKAFEDSKLLLRSSEATKLLILDQSGIKHITHDTFKELINFPATDFMFFISSFTLKRFLSVEKVGQYFPDISVDEIGSIPAIDIHRFVCQYYKKFVPSEKEFFLAPFSIKKRSNVYGIIFGTAILYGLEKFLKVCWDRDNISGEANYDIDDDIIRNGPILFKDMEISQKKDLFKIRLIDFLKEFRSNNDIYKFALENGCLPQHAFKILCKLQKDRRLDMNPPDTRKSSFYINWKNYNQQIAKIRIRVKNEKEQN